MAVQIAVVVPSHGRPVRLRWLLNALEEQTLARERWELIVATTGTGAEVADAHPVGARVVRPARTSAAAQRNAGWRATTAPFVLFTDDDCRPPAEWIERALGAAQAHPGAVIQGATRPDPDEAHLMTSPHARSQSIDPPVPWAQTCNILYPREMLVRLGGFDEAFPGPAGEDTDLAQRAIASGARYVGAPDVLTYHAVAAPSLVGHLRTLPRWGVLALVVKRHPHLRRGLPARVFWKHSHAWLPVAAAGAVVAARGRPLLGAALGVPWAQATGRRYGTDPRALARTVAELPGRAVVDVAEMAALVHGSIRHRSLLL